MKGVLVLGSAPTVHRGPYPADLAIWCVNGALGLVRQCETHVVLGKMLNTDTKARIRTRAELAHTRSAHLIVAYQDVDVPASMAYTTERREFLSPDACVEAQLAAGVERADTERERTISTGLLAVCLALTRQAGAVVVSGFSFQAKGHYYDRSAGTNWHHDVDRPVWETLRRRWPGRVCALGMSWLTLPRWEDV